MLFNEPKLLKYTTPSLQAISVLRFSALQRAEIAEIRVRRIPQRAGGMGFSALQRAEIAEIVTPAHVPDRRTEFQCSSTSRNC